MSPYFQRSQNELIIEALKKDGAKDHMFLDALSPSFMVDDIGYIYMCGCTHCCFYFYCILLQFFIQMSYLFSLTLFIMIHYRRHTMGDPWHYDGDAKWIYEWLLGLIAVGMDCEEKRDC